MRKHVSADRHQPSNTSATRELNQHLDTESDKDVLSKLLDPAKNPDKSEGDSSSHMSQAISKLVAIGTSVVDKAQEDEDRSSVQAEWILIGNILDRFFFILFLIVISAITIGFLGIYPLYNYTNAPKR